MEKTVYTCEACNFELPEKNRTSHEGGKKHRNNLERLGKTVAPLPPKPPSYTTVVVYGYPGYTQSQDLIKVFSTFGVVTLEKATKSNAILRFNDQETRNQALAANGKIILYGSYLKVAPYIERAPKNREFPQSKIKEYVVPPTTIDFSGNFTQQCESVLGAVRLSREQVERISLLYSQLTEHFQYMWPVGIFETAEAKVKFNDCHIRLCSARYRPLPTCFARHDASIFRTVARNLRIVEGQGQGNASVLKMMKNVESGQHRALHNRCVAVPFGSITTGLGIKSSDADCFIDIPPHLREGNHVSKARKRLAFFPRYYTEIIGIPRANTPIVKFFHIPTETNCDISFKTPLGARNSALIAFLLRADQRILYLCILIKYWAKVHNLTGTGKLSNYALTMLIIFYLQQEPTPLLPSVQWLQGTQSCFIDGWNTGFMDQVSLVPPVPNPVKLSQLLGGFFKFYANFNFADMIVCPYLGVTVPKKHFENLVSVPNDFKIYKQLVEKEYVNPIKTTTEMCVQDPFEQSHNVASCVGLKLFSEIKQTIAWAADLYEKDLPNDCINFLKNILLQKPKIQMMPNTKFKFYIQIATIKHLPEAVWKEKVIEKFFLIFEKLLRFDVTKQEVPPIDKGEVVHYREYYLCKSTQIVWRRKQMGKLYDKMQMDFLTKETKITEDLIKVDKTKKKPLMQVEVEIMFVKCPRKVTFLLRCENNGHNNFEEFGRFCVSTVTLWFVELFKLDRVNAASSPAQVSIENGNETSVEEIDTDNSQKEDEDKLSVGNDLKDVDKNTDTKTMSNCQDIPKPVSECTDGNISSPDNPPPKILKKN